MYRHIDIFLLGEKHFTYVIKHGCYCQVLGFAQSSPNYILDFKRKIDLWIVKNCIGWKTCTICLELRGFGLELKAQVECG
jgi:hypothetical protein